MAFKQIVDLDEIIAEWVEKKYGKFYKVIKIDISELITTQKSIFYRGTEDWWITKNEHVEIYENSKDTTDKYCFSFLNNYTSFATWSIVNGFKSSKYLPMNIVLEYPASREGASPLGVTFSICDLGKEIQKTSQKSNVVKLTDEIAIAPYTSVQMCKCTRSCVLKEVHFSNEIVFQGRLKIEGHKMGRASIKQNILVDISEVLANRENVGFMPEELEKNEKTGSRCTFFTIEGVCSGDVPVSEFVTKYAISTLV